MNTTFNFSRFLKILSNEWRLNLKKMLLFWGGMIVITILYFALFWYVQKDIISKETTFRLVFFLMCILQGFYLQNYYHEFSSKTKTQALLLLPVSRNETFWAKFLLGVILYLVIASAYLFIVVKWNGIHNDWMMELKKIPLDDWRFRHRDYQSYQTLSFELTAKLIYFLIGLFSTSAYLFGMMTFKKWAAFKSLVFWLMVVMGLVWVTCSIYALFTGVWPKTAIPGLIIVLDTADCATFHMYPELLYGLGIFICLALIVIARIKYNEKTI